MERLQIPLGTTPYTTRRSWRVVSLLILIGLVLGFGWRLSVLWLTRNTTARQMPDGTILAIRLTPNRGEWRKLEEHFPSLPVISNRGLRLVDLQDFAKGDLTLFIQSDGSRSVVVRTSEKKLPRPLLDAHDILIQTLSSHTFLLTDRLLPVVESPLPRFDLSRMLPEPTRLGTAYLLADRWKTGAVSLSKENVTLRFPRADLGRLPWKIVPSGVWAAVAWPTLQPLPFSEFSPSIETLAASFQIPSAAHLVGEGSGQSGAAILSSQNGKPGYLFLSPSGSVSEEEQTALLKAVTALASPKTESWRLPDETHASEIFVDPSLVTIESDVIGGVEVERTRTAQNRTIFSARHEGNFGLSDNQELIEFWLNQDKKAEHMICGGNHLWMDLYAIPPTSSIYGTRPTFIDNLSQIFSKISVNSSFLSTKIKLCF